MQRPRPLLVGNARQLATLFVVLALVCAQQLPAATVLTGDVTPELPWDYETSPEIGITGVGELVVDQGSELFSGGATLGISPGSTGTATITGAGSAWHNSTTLYVGESGNGELRVNAGGRVRNPYGYLGYEAGSTGTATITGAGSRWSNADLFVGGSGSGALTVEDEGHVTADTLYASLNDLHGNGTIGAAGAILDADLQFNGAHPGEAVLEFGDGGTLTVKPTFGRNYLGAGYRSQGSLTISAGESVTSDRGYLGYHVGSTGTVTVTGAGSMWANIASHAGGASYLHVGDHGSGTLRVEAGGQVSNTIGRLGAVAGSTGTATITGVGSTWSNSGWLYVGNDGSGELRVEAGGKVSSSGSSLGRNAGSTGTATITGAGSRWTNRTGLHVGYSGGGALTVEDGGEVTAATLYSSLGDLHGNGTIMATTGAVLDADLRFNAAHPREIVLGFGDGGMLTMTAAGGDLGAGYWEHGSLTISEGVAVSSHRGYLGYRSGSTGTAIISGPGSAWNNRFDLSVGSSGNGALRVEAGGLVSNDEGSVGFQTGSTGAVVVTGPGSTWSNVATFVGERGAGTLHVEAGGQVSSSTGFVGAESGSSGTATITGAGSAWTNSSGLYIGDDGNGVLRVEAGGQVSSKTGYLGAGRGSNGAAIVSGAGSTWISSDWFVVGDSGSGELRVDAGGHVSSNLSYLGAGTNSTGAATISGAGSRWTNGGDFYVGTYGSGEVFVESGGLVSVGGTLTIGSQGDSFVNLTTGGMLALWGNAGDSLAQFLDLVAGTDAIRYWDAGLAAWAPLPAASLGVDYMLQYQDAGDLTGYTLLTVGTLPTAGDFDLDGRVDGADLLAWQRGGSPTPSSPEDLARWQANYGLAGATHHTTAVPEPRTLTLAGLAVAGLLLVRGPSTTQ